MKHKKQKVGNVPILRFPGFEELWEKKSLGDITLKVNSGKTPLGGEAMYTDYGVIFIRSQNVNNNHLDLTDTVFISEQTNNTMKNSIIAANDILLNITGASLGRSCVVPSNFKVGNVNQHVCIIRPTRGYNPRFIQAFLSSGKGQNTLKSLQTGSGREGLNFENIKSVPINIPQENEQFKIAEFLELLSNRIQTQIKLIKSLKTQMSELQTKIFKQQLKFKDSTKGQFSNWKFCPGGEVFENISNKTKGKNKPILAITQDKGAIPRELIDYQISVTEKSIDNYKEVEIGDFIISLRSFQGGIEHSEYEGICSPAYVVLRNKKEVNRLFYKYFFKTNFYIQSLNKKLEGIRDGKMISYKYFSEIMIPFPSLEEQNKIANILNALDKKINLEKNILTQLEKQKKYLLQNLFA